MMAAVRFASLVALSVLVGSTAKADWDLSLRYQKETKPGSGRYHQLTRTEKWKPQQTAIIVCDMWDAHHCLNAVRRSTQFAPRLNNLLIHARRDGAVIIHAPSGCMDAYAEHPSRKRAQQTPKAKQLPEDIRSWCSWIPHESGVYPIDQSDGGEDDDPAEHAEWADSLMKRGLDPRRPWKKQMDLIDIDPQRDYVSDKGDEIWSILDHHGVDNVVLTGVHTNMCVLGRPFGLRQMARNGKNVVLMRDLTDTMYNPKMWPYVSHFSGTDLIVEHIERFVCPTVTSNQVLRGEEFRFEKDNRPHIAVVIAEDEYETDSTLPAFAAAHLNNDFRVTLIFGSETERNSIPGIEALAEADVALFSVRRRVLPAEAMAVVKRFVASGKPVLGIRTASHAFSLRQKDVPAGMDDWPEFDAQVFGGNYHGHFSNKTASDVKSMSDQVDHPILGGKQVSFAQGGSLYKTSPLAERATILLTGKIEGMRDEPVAWTFRRADGGRSFYTSLGHPEDFTNPAFVALLVRAIDWSVNGGSTE